MNIVEIRCPHCGLQKCDVMAIIGRAKPNGKGEKKTILYRCLSCKKQFEKSPKDNPLFKKFFNAEAVEKAMRDA